jgi:hypothetical protein
MSSTEAKLCEVLANAGLNTLESALIISALFGKVLATIRSAHGDKDMSAFKEAMDAMVETILEKTVDQKITHH